MASLTYKDRAAYPFWWKINPIWWFSNIDEPTPPVDYHPTWYYVFRVIWWFLRNPLHNFMMYVIGVADRNYTVYSSNPVDLNVWADVGKTGLKGSIILFWGFIPLPYISYSGKYIISYLGWQPSGRMGAKITLCL